MPLPTDEERVATFARAYAEHPEWHDRVPVTSRVEAESLAGVLNRHLSSEVWERIHLAFVVFAEGAIQSQASAWPSVWKLIRECLADKERLIAFLTPGGDAAMSAGEREFAGTIRQHFRQLGPKVYRDDPASVVASYAWMEQQLRDWLTAEKGELKRIGRPRRAGPLPELVNAFLGIAEMVRAEAKLPPHSIDEMSDKTPLFYFIEDGLAGACAYCERLLSSGLEIPPSLTSASLQALVPLRATKPRTLLDNIEKGVTERRKEASRAARGVKAANPEA